MNMPAVSLAAMHIVPGCAVLCCPVGELPPEAKLHLKEQLTAFIEAIDKGTLRGRFAVTRTSLIGIGQRH
jgi:hypothetical protein